LKKEFESDVESGKLGLDAQVDAEVENSADLAEAEEDALCDGTGMVV
jgi:hypothetical protein